MTLDRAAPGAATPAPVRSVRRVCKAPGGGLLDWSFPERAWPEVSWRICRRALPADVEPYRVASRRGFRVPPPAPRYPARRDVEFSSESRWREKPGRWGLCRRRLGSPGG